MAAVGTDQIHPGSQASRLQEHGHTLAMQHTAMELIFFAAFYCTALATSLTAESFDNPVLFPLQRRVQQMATQQCNASWWWQRILLGQQGVFLVWESNGSDLIMQQPSSSTHRRGNSSSSADSKADLSPMHYAANFAYVAIYVKFNIAHAVKCSVCGPHINALMHLRLLLQIQWSVGGLHIEFIIANAE